MVFSWSNSFATLYFAAGASAPGPAGIGPGTFSFSKAASSLAVH
jgi:hypothetical protein